VSEEVTRVVYPRRITPLIKLLPEWLTDGTRPEGHKVVGTRFGMGVRLLCPGHSSENHRINLWFLNPIDGGPPRPAHALYYRTGECFEELTLHAGETVVRRGEVLHEAISVASHWVGYIHGGYVIDALRVS
jgi:hypothetical protein